MKSKSLLKELKKSLEKNGLKEDVNELLERSTAIVFTSGNDVVNVCKTLVNFSRENQGFTLKGGFLNKNKISAEKLDALSKLPPREILLAQAIRAMASPLTGFACALNNIILKFVWLIEEIKIL